MILRPRPRRRCRRAAPGRGVLAAAVLAALGALAPAQRASFEGWGAVQDDDFVYDPDDRPVLGFSVRASTPARAALDEARVLLEREDHVAAGRHLLEVMERFGDHVVQVGELRWVGAGEWARYLLLARIPDEVRARLAREADRERIDAAARWRDAGTLVDEARRLDGLPESRRAFALATRILAERGEHGRARALGERGLQIEGEGDVLAELVDRLPRRASGSPEAPRLPEELTASWAERITPVRITRQDNPFAERTSVGEAPIAPIVPVVEDGVLYVADSLSVGAYDVFNGRERWHYAGPMEQIFQDRSSNRWFDFTAYARFDRPRAVSPYLVCEPVLAGDVVLAVVQGAEPRRQVRYFDNRPINWPLPRRRLVALDRATGRLLWAQDRADLSDDAFENTFDVAGPPAVEGGVVYTSGFVTEGAISAYFAAFDLRTGELRWKTYVCSGQQELTMFNRPFQEHTGSPLVHRHGTLYGATNLGVIASVDAFSGRVRWVTGYEPMRRPPSRHHSRNNRREIYWVNQRPQFVADRVAVTPLDSERLYAIDPSTGRVRYTIDALEHYRSSIRNQALAVGGSIYLVGESNVESFDGRYGDWRWGERVDFAHDEVLAGPASLTGSWLLVPTTRALKVVDLEARETIADLPFSPRHGWRAGLHGPVLALSTHDEFGVVLEAETALSDALARADDGSTGALLDAADLMLELERFTEADELYARVLDVGTADLRARARQARVDARLGRARRLGTQQAWQDALAVAESLPARLRELLPEAMDHLARSGDEAVRARLERLVELFGDEPLDLGMLTSTAGGPKPAGVVLAMMRLETDPPRRAVERLQGLIEEHGAVDWQGRRLGDWAAARIDELVARHGHRVYEAVEARARQALGAAGSAERERQVEARFPNAAVVAASRRERLTDALGRGLAGEVFAELRRLPPWSLDEELAALRVEAAHRLGEDALAAALSRAHDPPAPAPLGRLPRGQVARDRLAGAAGDALRFPDVDGALSEAFAGHVLATVDRPPGLVLVDAASGRVRWRHELGEGAGVAIPGLGVDLVYAGDRLVMRRGAALSAFALDDGRVLWTRELGGTPLGTVVTSGLVLTLSDHGSRADDRFELLGYGAGTGLRALEEPIPALMHARLHAVGDGAVVYTYDAIERTGDLLGARLHVVDVAGLRLGAQYRLPGSVAWVLRASAAPPALWVWGRDDGPRDDGWLAAFAWPSLESAWTFAPGVTTFSRKQVLAAGGGGALCVLPGERSESLRVVPVDVEDGPSGETVYDGVVRLAGQEDGVLPRLVLRGRDDLVVVDVQSGQPRARVELPWRVPLGDLDVRVAHARDGFVVVARSLIGAAGEALRAVALVDAHSGEVRYSTELEPAPEPATRLDVAVADGAVVVSTADTAWVLRGTEAF